MGYRSDVVVELHSRNESDLHVLLKTYAMSETSGQIVSAHHILGPHHAPYDFSYLVYNNDPQITALLFYFSNVKWYEESEDALTRLWKMVEAMSDELDICMYSIRVGEDADDIEVSQGGRWNYNIYKPVYFAHKSTSILLNDPFDSKPIAKPITASAEIYLKTLDLKESTNAI